MTRIARRWVCVTAIAVPLTAQKSVPGLQGGELTRAPRIWTEEQLRDWANPIAGINLSPKRPDCGKAGKVLRLNIGAEAAKQLHK